MQKLKKKQILSPVQGLDVSGPGDFIDPLSATDTQNMETKRRVIQKRLGEIALGATMGERILGMAELQIGINNYFVRAGLAKLEKYDRSTDTWANIAYAALSATEDDRVNFAFPLITGTQYMVVFNGVNAPRKYNGGLSDALLGGGPPIARYGVASGGYMIFAYIIDGGNTYFTRVQWCDTGDPENWTTGNAGSQDLITDGEGAEITAISTFSDYVAVHKENSIYLGQLVSTSEVFRFSRRETAGAVAQGSIQNLPGGLQAFLARDGLRVFNGVTSDLVPSSVNDDLRDSMSPQWIKRATSVLVRDLDEYWVGIPMGSDTEPTTIFKYNYRTQAMYKDTRADLMVMALSRRTDQATWDSDADSWDSDTTRWDSVVDLALHKAVVFGDKTGIVTQRGGSYDDNGTAVSAYWDTKDFNILDLDPRIPIGTICRTTQLEVYAKGTSVSLYYSVDEGVTWRFIKTLTLSSSYPTDAAPLFAFLDVVSSKIRFRFKNESPGGNFTLKQFWISMSPREARR